MKLSRRGLFGAFAGLLIAPVAEAQTDLLKVFIDTEADNGASIIKYKGREGFDAGVFYCPYVPLQMVRAQDVLQPKIGFKTRYV